MGKYMSQTEFAKAVGISRQAVSKLVKSGKLTTVGGKVEVDKAKKEYGVLKSLKVDNLIDKKSAWAIKTDANSRIGLSYNQAKAKKEAINAALKELELRKMQGELISVNETLAEFQKAGELIRSEFLTLPNRISPRLENKPAAEIQIIIEDAINECLKHLYELGIKLKVNSNYEEPAT